MANKFQPPIITHAGHLSTQVFSYGSVEITPVPAFGPLVITFENAPGGNAYFDRRFRWVRVTQQRNPRLTQCRPGNWTDEGINEVVINILNTVPEFARFNNSRGTRTTQVLPTALPLS